MLYIHEREKGIWKTEKSDPFCYTYQGNQMSSLLFSPFFSFHHSPLRHDSSVQSSVSIGEPEHLPLSEVCCWTEGEKQLLDLNLVPAVGSVQVCAEQGDQAPKEVHCHDSVVVEAEVVVVV